MVVLSDGGAPGHQTGGVDLGLHLSDLELGVLEGDDALAELLALLGILDGLVERALRDADGLRSDADTTAVKRAHGDLEALADLTEHAVRADADVVVGDDAVGGGADAHALDVVADGHAGRTLKVDDKGGHALRRGNAAVGQRKNDTGIGKAGVGGEDLGAVDDPLVAVLDSGGLRALHVRAGARLRQAVAADLAAVDQGTEIFLLLLLGAEVVDAGAAQRGMYGNGDASAGVDLGDLFHAQRIAQRIAACAAVFLRVGNAEEAVLLHLRQKLQIIGFLFVHLLGQRLDLRLRKAVEQLLLEKMGLVQFEIHNFSPWQYYSVNHSVISTNPSSALTMSLSPFLTMS